MSTGAGLLFLLGGIVLFAVAVVLLVARDKATRSPRTSLHRYRSARHSLHKIHHAQNTLRESDRARARAMHPAGRRARHRRRRAG